MRTLLPLLVLAAACGGSAPKKVAKRPPPPPACPQENGADAPTELEGAPALADGTVTGCFGRGADQADAFTVQAPEHAGPVVYRFSVKSAPGSKPCFELFDAGRAAVKAESLCAASPGATLDMWVAAQGGSTFGVRLKDLSGDRDGHDRPYTLYVTGEPLADAGEPNQDDATATEITVGETKEAFFATALNGAAQEMDVYRFAAPKAKLTFTVETMDPTVQFAARLRDAKGKVLIEKSAPNAGATLTFQNSVKKGTYTVELRNLAGAGTPAAGAGEVPQHLTQPYKLTVRR